MTDKIRIGIVGYGNLGKGVKKAIEQNPDLELVAVFTRRPPESLGIEANIQVVSTEAAEAYINAIDVMILCGGSAQDLPQQGPHFARMFNTVDSFDTHAKIPEYFTAMDEAARAGEKTSAISIGWDPGLFSLNRLLLEAILPEGKTYTFWGRGVSQGHSNAIKRIPGVQDAVQYTVPIETAVNRVRRGETPDLTEREKHRRECYVVAEPGADPVQIAAAIKSMPNYFADYDTSVTFITQAELEANHRRMPHGGFVIRSGSTGEENQHRQIAEFSLKLESNPEFTASVLVAYARAVHRLNREGKIGAKTIFDIPIGYLSSKTPEELRKTLL